MSSWQDYVDKHLLASRCVTKAAIAGHDGNVWAKSDGFDVSMARGRFTRPSWGTGQVRSGFWRSAFVLTRPSHFLAGRHSFLRRSKRFLNFFIFRPPPSRIVFGLLIRWQVGSMLPSAVARGQKRVGFCWPNRAYTYSSARAVKIFFHSI